MALLTQAQLTQFKTAILAETDPTFVAFRQANNEEGMAAFYNATASPAYVVWRSRVTRQDIYNTTSAEATTWNWTTYKAQAVSEQNAWTQMFMGDEANFAQPNLRAGVAAIFGAGNAQTTHALAVAKRNANRGEKVFGTGVGSTASPAVVAVEGTFTAQNISDALLRG